MSKPDFFCTLNFLFTSEAHTGKKAAQLVFLLSKLPWAPPPPPPPTVGQLRGQTQIFEFALKLASYNPNFFVKDLFRNKALPGQTMAWNYIGCIGCIGYIGCNGYIGFIGFIGCDSCFCCISQKITFFQKKTNFKKKKIIAKKKKKKMLSS